MKIKVCKTNEITEDEWKGITEGFSESFHRDSVAEDKKEFYSNNLFGFSYHAIAFDNSRVIGHTTVIPYYYKINNREEVIGLSSGTFVLKCYRKNTGLFKNMYDELRKTCNQEGMIGIFGVPNKNSFKYSTKILKKTHIGNLSYYLLPIRPANLFGFNKLSFLANPFSLLFFKIYLGMFLMLSNLFNPKEKRVAYFLQVTSDFTKARFKNGYQKIMNSNGVSGYFKVDNENENKIAYLLDFNNNGTRDLKSLCYVLLNIINNNDVDAIVWIGTLRIRPTVLIKIPRSFEPRPLPLTSEILYCGKTIVNEDHFLDFKNWHFSLINFDVK